MIARSDTRLVDAFRTTAAELAGDLCHASRPLLPVLQGSMLRFDELCITSGLERQSPLAAAAMALGPAVAAAGTSVSAMARMSPEEANRVAGVAESVVEVAIDALNALDSLVDGGEPAIAFAHRLAHTTHQASALAGGPRLAGGGMRRGHPARVPALWPQLLSSLSTRIRVKQHWKDGPGLSGWMHRVEAASACRDAAVHSMRAHALIGSGGGGASGERLLRSLTFASLYCGFAMLDRPPWATGCVAVRAHGVATDRGPVPVQLRRLVYPFRPGGQGAVALI
jgi:hypothetical protein